MIIKNLLFLSNQSAVSMPPWNKWCTVATVPARNNVLLHSGVGSEIKA